MRNPALRIGWAMSTCTLLTLFATADIFQTYNPVFPLRPVLVAALTSHAAAAALTVVMGKFELQNFRLFQPFEGGASFVAMQSVGWTGWAITTAGTYLYAIFCTTDQPKTSGSVVPDKAVYGLLSALGVIGAGSSVLNFCSLGRFEPQRKETSASQVRRLQLEALLAVFLALAGLGTCVLAEIWPAEVGNDALIFFGLFHLGYGVLIHFSIGWLHTPSYRLFMPFSGGIRNIMFQGIAWFLYALVSYCILVLLFLPCDGSFDRCDIAQIYPNAKILLGLLGLISCVMLLLQVYYFRQQENERRELEKERSRSILGQKGAFVISVLTGSVAVFITITSVIMLLPSSNYMLGFAWSKYLTRFPHRILRVGQLILIGGTMPGPLFTHFSGHLLHGPKYNLWRPFDSHGRDFLILQAVGWSFYAFATVAIVLEFHWKAAPPIWTCAFLVVTQCTIHGSVRSFRQELQPDEKDFSSKTPSSSSSSASPLKLPTPTAEEQRSKMMEDESFVSWELLLGGALAMLSLLLRLACDWIGPSDSNFPLTAVSTLATVQWAISVPVAHLAKRRKGEPLFRPFRGAPEYVALQAVGWAFYAICLTLSALIIIDFHETQGHHTSLSKKYRLAHTVHGCALMIPLGLIAASAYFRRGQHLCELDSDVIQSTLTKLSPTGQYAEIKLGELIEATSGLSETVLYHAAQETETPAIRQLLLQLARVAKNTSVREPAGLPPEPHKAIAWIIVLCLSAASFLFFVFADSVRGTDAIDSLAAMVGTEQAMFLGSLAFLIAIGCCLVVHAFYGPYVNQQQSISGIVRDSSVAPYSFWMPFQGGPSFIALQLCAIATLSAGFVLFVFSAARASSDLKLLTTKAPILSGFLPAGVLSSIAPPLALASVYTYDPSAAGEAAARKSFFVRHAEGIVSLLVFLVGWAFASFYELTNSEDSTNMTLAAAPVLIGNIALVIAVPLAFVALRKSARQYKKIRAKKAKDGAETESDLEERRRCDVDVDDDEAVPPLFFAEFVAMGGLLLVPLIVLASFHYFHFQYGEQLVSAVAHVKNIFPILMGLLLLTLLTRSPASEGIVGVYGACIVTMLYNAPQIVFFSVVAHCWFRPSIGSLMTLLNVFVTISPKVVRQGMMFIDVGIASYLSFRAATQIVTGNAASQIAEGSTIVWDWPILILDAVVIFEDSLWLAVCALYLSTFDRKFEYSGKRYSPAFVDWMCQHMFVHCQRYFRFRLINESGIKFQNDPNHKYIFAFIPHGVFPITPIWAPCTAQWKETLGSTKRITLHAASVVFNIPLLRDLAMGVGARTVTKVSIENALAQGHFPMIVPGGQAEMLVTGVSDKQVNVVTFHKGFIRMAIDHKACVVPVFCFGEHNILDNVHFGTLQKKMLTWFGYVFSFPIGRWYTSVPHAPPLTIVIGNPSNPIADVPGVTAHDFSEKGSAAYEAAIDKVAEHFYKSLKASFYKYRTEAGYSSLELCFAKK